MKKIFLTILGLVVLNSAFANSCRVYGDKGSVTVRCSCTNAEACAKAQEVYAML